MSKASDIIDEFETQIASDLGASYIELPRGFDIETIDAHRLTNGYKAIFLDPANEEIGIETCRITLTRVITVIITYRTFTTQVDNKADTVYRTALANEETLVASLRDYAFTTVGLNGGVRDLVSSVIEPFIAGGESFLRNELKFTTFYRLS